MLCLSHRIKECSNRHVFKIANGEMPIIKVKRKLKLDPSVQVMTCAVHLALKELSGRQGARNAALCFSCPLSGSLFPFRMFVPLIQEVCPPTGSLSACVKLEAIQAYSYIPVKVRASLCQWVLFWFSSYIHDVFSLMAWSWRTWWLKNTWRM